MWPTSARNNDSSGFERLDHVVPIALIVETLALDVGLNQIVSLNSNAVLPSSAGELGTAVESPKACGSEAMNVNPW